MLRRPGPPIVQIDDSPQGLSSGRVTAMVDVFVSYARKDARRVEPLVELLEARGLDVWWDRDLKPGSRYETQIEAVIDAASCVLIALTEHAAQSDWMRAEAAAAQERDKVIPVLLDDVSLPLSLRAFQVADLRSWPDACNDEADKLVRALTARVQPQPQPRNRSFVGRADALGTFSAALDATLTGSGGTVMLAGEPGIGKTRCAEEFARVAEDRGCLVLWGRCYEQPGAPAYWPWVQVLREYVDAHTDDELRIAIGSNAATLAPLVPELGERLSLGAQSTNDDNIADNQYRLFDAVSRVLARAAGNVPIVVVLDDLHWADASSLALLEYLAKDVRRQRCLLLCTYRDVEVTRKSPLLGTLGELGRSGRVDRIRLSGLSTEETAELSRIVSGVPIPLSAAEAIHQQTDGNPLFVREVANVIAEEHRQSSGDFIAVDVPDGIREAIGRSLDRLDALANAVLSAASALGRNFDLAVVAGATKHPLAVCVDAIDAAIRLGMVERTDKSTRYRFTHAVIRETLYAEIPTLERLALHRQIADTLADVSAHQLDEVLAELAFHYGEAAALGDHEPAIEFAIRAAQRALKIFAGEEAFRYYDDALRLLKSAGREHDPIAAQCLVEEARVGAFLGRYGDVLEVCTFGIDVARALCDAPLFNYFARWLVRITSYAPQHHAVALVEEALRLLADDDLSGRAVTLAHLAFAQRGTGDMALVATSASESVRLASTHADPADRLLVIHLVTMALRGDPSTLATRLRYGSQAMDLLSRVEPTDESAEVMYWQLHNLLEAGDLNGYESLLDRYQRFARERNFHRHDLQAQCMRVVLQHLRGHWERLDDLIESTCALARQLDRRLDSFGGDGAYGAQMFALNRDTGRLREMAPVLRSVVEREGARTWAPGFMALCIEIGALDAARSAFESFAAQDFSDLARDDMWLASMVYCAETCAVLADKERAARLYDLLKPYSGQTANHPTAVCFGAVDHYLGLLSRTNGEVERARCHFEKAAAMNRAMGAWPYLARTWIAQAHLLLDTDAAENLTAGRALLNEAEQLAERLGMKGLLADIAASLNEDLSQLPDGLTAREVEVLKLLAIGRSNKDISKALAISLSTVATHVRNILTKSGSANRTEAAAYAMRHELT